MNWCDLSLNKIDFGPIFYIITPLGNALMFYGVYHVIKEHLEKSIGVEHEMTNTQKVWLCLRYTIGVSGLALLILFGFGHHLYGKAYHFVKILVVLLTPTLYAIYIHFHKIEEKGDGKTRFKFGYNRKTPAREGIFSAVFGRLAAWCLVLILSLLILALICVIMVIVSRILA